MKTNIFTILALSIVLLISGCGKETDNKQAINSNQEEDAGLMIESFITKMDQYQKGIPLKSGGRWSIDSAIWYIDAALNYTYADAGHAFAKLHRDTLYTEMPLLNGYEAAYENVFEAYDTFLTGLSRHYYEEVEGDNKQFIMAMVDNMGPLPDGKQKLRIITFTGTGTPPEVGLEFGNNQYFYAKNVFLNCLGVDMGTNAPLLLETKLHNFFNPSHPTLGCRWYHYGSKITQTLYYQDHRIPNDPLDNLMDYKIFFASELVAPFTLFTECLEFHSEVGSGIHEMSFYLFHLKYFVEQWLISPQNIGNYKFAYADIDGIQLEFNNSLLIYHVPKLHYRLRGVACSIHSEIPGEE